MVGDLRQPGQAVVLDIAETAVVFELAFERPAQLVHDQRDGPPGGLLCATQPAHVFAHGGRRSLSSSAGHETIVEGGQVT